MKVGSQVWGYAYQVWEKNGVPQYQSRPKAYCEPTLFTVFNDTLLRVHNQSLNPTESLRGIDGMVLFDNEQECRESFNSVISGTVEEMEAFMETVVSDYRKRITRMEKRVKRNARKLKKCKKLVEA